MIFVGIFAIVVADMIDVHVRDHDHDHVYHVIPKWSEDLARPLIPAQVPHLYNVQFCCAVRVAHVLDHVPSIRLPSVHEIPACRANLLAGAVYDPAEMFYCHTDNVGLEF